MNSYALNVIQRAAKIKILLMDVDGVLTDGRLFYLTGGENVVYETKSFNSHDGLGLHFLHFAGIKTGVISGRESPAVVERAKILNMTYVYQGFLDKRPAFAEILNIARVKPEDVAFVGDDYTDVPLLLKSGLGVAVANARQEVQELAHLTTKARGGEGAIREVAELLLKSQGLWSSVVAAWGFPEGAGKGDGS